MNKEKGMTSDDISIYRLGEWCAEMINEEGDKGKYVVE
jgi:hypothetical protein